MGGGRGVLYLRSEVCDLQLNQQYKGVWGGGIWYLLSVICDMQLVQWGMGVGSMGVGVSDMYNLRS